MQSFAGAGNSGLARFQFCVDMPHPGHRVGWLWDAGSPLRERTSDVTAPVIERWLRVIENGQTDELDDLLAEDAVFYSPAVFTPQHGREKTAMYLRAAEKLFSHSNFHYTNKWIENRSAVLEFAAEVDGLTVEGVDIIQWNDDGKIVSFKVMIRPLKALQAIVPRMGELLLTS